MRHVKHIVLEWLPTAFPFRASFSSVYVLMRMRYILLQNQKGSYPNKQMMRTHVLAVVLGVGTVLIRRQQFAPKLSICSSRGGHVYWKAQGISDTFKCAIKHVVRGEHSNSSYVQIMEFFFWKLTLFKCLSERTPSFFRTFYSWCEKHKRNVFVE